MSLLVPPHGDRGLRPLHLQGRRGAEELRRAQTLRKLRITSRERGDLIMLGIGGFTPLDGFMSRADWQRVCDDMHTPDGLFWPIPITLSTDEATADAIAIGEDVARTTRRSKRTKRWKSSSAGTRRGSQAHSSFTRRR